MAETCHVILGHQDCTFWSNQDSNQWSTTNQININQCESASTTTSANFTWVFRKPASLYLHFWGNELPTNHQTNHQTVCLIWILMSWFLIIPQEIPLKKTTETGPCFFAVEGSKVSKSARTSSSSKCFSMSDNVNVPVWLSSILLNNFASNPRNFSSKSPPWDFFIGFYT